MLSLHRLSCVKAQRKKIRNRTKYCEAKKKNVCGSGNLTYPKFLSPTLNFFLRFLKLEEKNRTKLFCSANLFKLQSLKKKNISQ